MTLGEKQRLFARLELQLRLKIYMEGYEVTLGHAFRSRAEQQRLGHRGVHPLKLAVDLNLFLNGVYLRTTAAHWQFGEWWEQQHPLCRWGGRFGDGNHYSFEHNGVK